MKLREILGVLRDSYCRTIGVEYMHIQNPEERGLDPGAGGDAARRARPRGAAAHPGPLNTAEAFETFLQTKYVGQKRFSLEGGESLIPLLDSVISAAADAGARRGRDRHGPPWPPQRAGQHRRQVLRQIFGEFEGNLDPRAPTAPAT